jgi:hypothetical protein
MTVVTERPAAGEEPEVSQRGSAMAAAMTTTAAPVRGQR